ncbi:MULTISPECIES: hypothetical protein [unclassified Leptolyngbya]|uniref:hypothetical protein n=1 Tax=unclassified Leptolyngbya TaxID=2650499 RepID=UPI00168488C3|nr:MULTISPECIES: hypothetical protein [unclassified Leptolyngbya]MBD1909992.1 hypothetical protein [Leptolyngbya sp. FACHB-8]MBD2157129.1 hypothetical protein [Leptolyngbya sp. FACHB-16]
MRGLRFLFGLGLVVVGVYFLGQNIIFTTQTAGYWWRPLSAAATVLSMMAGIISLTFFGRSGQSMGWFCIGLAMVLAIASGGLVIRPTSLWTFFVAMMSFVGGFRLIQGRSLGI